MDEPALPRVHRRRQRRVRRPDVHGRTGQPERALRRRLDEDVAAARRPRGHDGAPVARGYAERIVPPLCGHTERRVVALAWDSGVESERRTGGDFVSSFASRISISRSIIVAATAAFVVSLAVSASAQGVKNAEAAKIKNPVKSSPESIAAGKTAYGKYCKFCHAEDATGNGALAPKDTHPPNLVDATWDH